VSVPDKSAPAGLATAAAAAAERAWRLLRRPGPPPLTRFAVWASGKECTLDISRARTELGYEPVRTREEGLAQLAG
jgi:nucleoside-diphosphate-sugar epimerase